MDIRTFLVRHKVNTVDANPVSTPIFHTSAFRAGDPYFYTRKGNPNFSEVEDIVKELDKAAFATMYGSGMAAIASVLNLLESGSKLIVNKLIYGCSYRFLSDACKRRGISLIYCDLTLPENHQLLDASTDMVLFETPTNPFLQTVNIGTIVDRLKKNNPNGLVVVDNTWATPLFQNPLALGADIAVYSGSKFFGGHSDVICGFAVTNTQETAESLEKHRFYEGAVPDPFSAWLVRRSFQTFSLRMERHVVNTAIVSEFVKSHTLIDKIYLPTVDGNQLRNYGGLFFAKTKMSYQQFKTVTSSLKLFDFGTPMASVTSAIACPYHGSHLSMTAEEKTDIGLDESIIRFSVGLEDPQDLIEDLRIGFKSIA